MLKNKRLKSTFLYRSDCCNVYFLLLKISIKINSDFYVPKVF